MVTSSQKWVENLVVIYQESLRRMARGKMVSLPEIGPLMSPAGESMMDFYQNRWILQFQSQNRQRPKIEFNIVMSEQFRTLFTIQIFIRIIFL